MVLCSSHKSERAPSLDRNQRNRAHHLRSVHYMSHSIYNCLIDLVLNALLRDGVHGFSLRENGRVHHFHHTVLSAGLAQSQARTRSVSHDIAADGLERVLGEHTRVRIGCHLQQNAKSLVSVKCAHFYQTTHRCTWFVITTATPNSSAILVNARRNLITKTT